MDNLMQMFQRFFENVDLRGTSIILVPMAIGLYLLVRQARKTYRHTKKIETYHLALRMLDDIIARDPGNAMAFWQKGEVYEAMERADQAIRFYQAAHNLCPRAYGSQEFTSAYERLKGNMKFKPAIRNLSRV